MSVEPSASASSGLLGRGCLAAICAFIPACVDSECGQYGQFSSDGAWSGCFSRTCLLSLLLDAATC